MVKKNTDCLSCSSLKKGELNKRCKLTPVALKKKGTEQKMQVDLKMYSHFYFLASFGFAVNPFTTAMTLLENDQQKCET